MSIHTPLQLYLDGRDSRDDGIYCLSVPPVAQPAKRVELITVPGRSGVLTVWRGDYGPIDKRILVGTEDESTERVRGILGAARSIRLSPELDRIYDCIQVEQQDFRQLNHTFDGRGHLYLPAAEARARGSCHVWSDAGCREPRESAGTAEDPHRDRRTPSEVVVGRWPHVDDHGCVAVDLDRCLLGVVQDAGGHAWHKLDRSDLPRSRRETAEISVTNATSMTVQMQERWV